MHHEGLGAVRWLLLFVLTVVVMLVCLALGSVSIPLQDTVRILLSAAGFRVGEASDSSYRTILLTVRLPRVLCCALSGASLSISGCTMQGLLRNQLADGSTLGVSSGAALGAVLAIALGFSLPGFPLAGTMVSAMIFSVISLLVILTLTWRLDRSLSTNTLILMGIVFSMFVSALLSLVITLFPKKLTSITFWTMGSLAGSSYQNALVLAVVLVLLGSLMLTHASELNAFAVSEENAGHIGVDVKRSRVMLMGAASLLVGACVSIGGSIGFVGLVTPHIMRLIVGPNHKKLLPASLFAGAIFLMLTDLISRTIASPRELPIGVVTSLIGAVVFVITYYRIRTRRALG